jgi:hypothetical protein
MALQKQKAGTNVDLNATDKRGKTLLQYGDCAMDEPVNTYIVPRGDFACPCRQRPSWVTRIASEPSSQLEPIPTPRCR